MNSENWRGERMDPEDTANKIKKDQGRLLKGSYLKGMTCDQPYRLPTMINNNNNALSSYMALGGARQGCSG